MIRLYSVYFLSRYVYDGLSKKKKKKKQEAYALSLFPDSKDRGIYVELRACRLSHFNTVELALNVLTEWRLYGDSVQGGLSERLPLHTHAVRAYLVRR